MTATSWTADTGPGRAVIVEFDPRWLEVEPAGMAAPVHVTALSGDGWSFQTRIPLTITEARQVVGLLGRAVEAAEAAER
jgi:hypothetical protein